MGTTSTTENAMASEWRERWEDAQRVAEEYDKALRADDPRFKRSVQIRHGDGAVLFYPYAFLLRYNGFLLLFTEHHRWRVFDPDDLEAYAEYKQLSRIGKLERG